MSNGSACSIVEENRLLNAEELKRGETRLASAPMVVNIEVTGRCNIVPPCVFCAGKSQGQNYDALSLGYLDRYRPLLDRSTHVNDCSFGEPLTHPQFIDLARQVTSNGQGFSFATNGLLLKGSKADELAKCGPRLAVNISVNAATAETYKKLNGHDFHGLVQNIREYIAKCKENYGQPAIVLTFIVMKVNQGEVADFLRLAKELGCQALLTQLHPTHSPPRSEFGYCFLYEDEKLAADELAAIGTYAKAVAAELGQGLLLQWEATDEYLGVIAEKGASTPCKYPWRSLQILDHSKQVFCCWHHNAPLGSLEEDSIEEIWNGERQRTIRRDLVQGVVPDFCLRHSTTCPVVQRLRKSETSTRGRIESRIVVGGNDNWHFSLGWYDRESSFPAFRWASREASFQIRRAPGTVVCFECFVSGRPRREGPVSGFLECGGVKQCEFRIRSKRLVTVRGLLPQEGSAGPVTCRIVIENPWRPCDMNGSTDQRLLGVAVTRIWCERKSWATRLGSDVARKATATVFLGLAGCDSCIEPCAAQGSFGRPERMRRLAGD